MSTYVDMMLCSSQAELWHKHAFLSGKVDIIDQTWLPTDRAKTPSKRQDKF